MEMNSYPNHASDLAKHWLLDKDAFYLNHGAFWSMSDTNT